MAGVAPQVDLTLARQFRRASRFGGLLLIALGVAVLTGWAFDISTLKSIHPSLSTMKANSAILFVLLGGVLAMGERDRKGRIRYVLGSVIVVIAAVTLLQYVLGTNLGIDELVFRAPATRLRPPGRMAPVTAMNFLAFGLALLLLDTGKRFRPGQLLTGAAGITSLLAVCGYAYDVRSLYATGPYTAIALHSSLGFLVASVAILLARPETGVMALVTSDTDTGALVRRLVPVIVFLPMLLGWVRLLGQRLGLYDSTFGDAFLVLLNVGTLGSLTWLIASSLERAEIQRRHAQGELTKSEEDLAITLYSIGDAVIATEVTGSVVRMNPVAEQLTGWTLSSAIGKPLDEVFHILDAQTRARVESPVEHVLREGRIMGFANHPILLSRDGSEYPIADSGAPIRDAKGELRGVVLVFRDVTEQVEAQRALRTASERLQVLADTSSQFAAATVDHPRLLDLVGRRLGEIIGTACLVRLISPDGKSLEDSEACIYHPDPELVAAYREIARTTSTSLTEGLAGHVATTGEAVLIPSLPTSQIAARAPPQFRSLVERMGVTSVLCVPLRSRDRVIGVVVMLRGESTRPFTPDNQRLAQDLADRAALAIENAALMRDLKRRVSELRAAEERFRELLESAPDAMVIADKSGRIVLINAQAEALFGYQRSEVLGKPIELFVPEPHRAAHPGLREGFSALPRVRHVMAAGKEPYGRRKDGSEFVAEISLSPIGTPEGVWITASIRDITDRKRLEEFRRKAFELEEQNRRTQESDRLKSEFLANMSHELRTPLNAVIGFTSLMHSGKVGPLSEVQKEYLGDIINSSRHLLQLINDVLDLAKIESGRVELRLESVDLAKLAQEVKEVVRGLAAEKHLRLVLEVEDAIDRVTVDPRMLKQVLYNYLSNAIKFTPEGGQVSLRIAAEGDHSYRVEVEDTGIGIKPEDMNRLFVEFQQLDQGTTKKYAGTGLGLALTRRIVEAQGGRVEVKSTVGKGSTFSAVLPREVKAGKDA
jgi:PAS domain S-box-containing protein